MPHRTNPKRRSICIIESILSNRTQLSQAISSLELLSSKGIHLPSKILASLINHCAVTKSLKEGKWVHLHMKLTGLKQPSTILCNHLIHMYFKCGSEFHARMMFDKMSVRNVYSWNNMLSGYSKLGMVKQSRALFDKMTERDVISWNTMIIGYAQSGFWEEGLRFYRELRRSGIGFNDYSFAGVLTVCVKMGELALTTQVHGQVLVSGFLSNVVLSSSLVDAYSRCQEMVDARRLFDEMKAKDVLAWTTLVSGYAKSGDMNSASELFDQMPEKNPVSWTTMISGYARNSMGHKALELFSRMMLLHIRPDQFTYSSCLCACASISLLKHGKQIHGSLIKTNLRPNAIIVSSLVDMYSKCGNVDVGRQVFEIMGNKQDSVLWNTMISALAQHGRGEEALQMFDAMVRSGMKPNRITLTVSLNACSHSGLVQEGLRYFESMTCDHGIVPSQEHYACLVDLLGRAGCFDELINQLKKMPCKPDKQVLNALLGVCRIRGNIELGRKVAEQLIELEPQSSAAYVLLSSIYAVLGKWESVVKVRQLMKKRRVKKEQAFSWIEIGNKVHGFTVSDGLHPSKEVVYSVLEQLVGQMEENALSLDSER